MAKFFIGLLSVLAGPILLLIMIGSIAYGAPYQKDRDNPEIVRHSLCRDLSNVGVAALDARMRGVRRDRVILQFTDKPESYRRVVREVYDHKVPFNYFKDTDKKVAKYRENIYRRCQKGLY